MVTKVVVPLDGSQLAARSLVPARTLAERTGACLLLMTTHWDGEVDEPRDHLEKQAADLGFERVETKVVRDRLAGAAILAEANERGAVVCMATHGRGGLGRTVLGSVAEEVLRHSTRPLLLVGPALEPGAWQFQHWFVDTGLLVAIDGSRASEAIVPVAAEWCSVLGLQPWVVQVAPDPDPGLEAERGIETGGVRRAAESLAFAGLDPQWEVLHGDDVATSLLDFATHLPAALIAMTTHGRGGVARVALGSVAMRIVHHSRCPVLVLQPARAG